MSALPSAPRPPHAMPAPSRRALRSVDRNLRAMLIDAVRASDEFAAKDRPNAAHASLASRVLELCGVTRRSIPPTLGSTEDLSTRP